jgi:hypothetical protein
MESLKDVCNGIRAAIEQVKAEVVALHDIPSNGEVHENITLSFRHLEDARMRLGKAIQADGDGISIYDKKESKKC